MKTTTSFDKILNMQKRVRVVQGGTRAGKTYAILQILLVTAIQAEVPILISIVSESFPHLKRGAMRDFFNILKYEGIYSEKNHNKTDNIYQIGNATIEFFSVDQPDKLRGAGRDILFFNECNSSPLDTYNQLEVRTKRTVYLDYNPTAEFWVHEEVLPQDDAERIILTYQDNEFLDENIVKSIEKRKPKYDKFGNLISGDENWWKVYGEGQTGRLEGLIFQNWQQINEIPAKSKFLGYGQDFGFSNDPATCVWVGLHGEDLVLDEIFYKTGMLNSDISRAYASANINPNDEIIADSAEPKSIEELYRAGWNIHPAEKGKDSVNFGIDLMKERKILITKRSVNLIKELRNYQWKTDKTGKSLNIPVDDFNHGIDAVRYVVLKKLAKAGQIGFFVGAG